MIFLGFTSGLCGRNDTCLDPERGTTPFQRGDALMRVGAMPFGYNAGGGIRFIVVFHPSKRKPPRSEPERLEIL